MSLETKFTFFGFSRGAYTARSLAGLIRNSGLIRAECVSEFEQKNTRLKKFLAEAELDKAALKDLLSRKW
jgi:uncharacterized protein (DUF2235 family)